jgi:hypothetical protein
MVRLVLEMLTCTQFTAAWDPVELGVRIPIIVTRRRTQ